MQKHRPLIASGGRLNMGIHSSSQKLQYMLHEHLHFAVNRVHVRDLRLLDLASNHITSTCEYRHKGPTFHLPEIDDLKEKIVTGYFRSASSLFIFYLICSQTLLFDLHHNLTSGLYILYAAESPRIHCNPYSGNGYKFIASNRLVYFI